MSRVHRACAVLAAVALTACGSDKIASAQKALRDTHGPEALRTIDADRVRHTEGVKKAAEKLAPGFAVQDPAQREREMRTALRFVQRPRKGIPELVATSMSFLAAVGKDGIVIARDADPDKMKGVDFAAKFPVVRRALSEGVAGYDLGEFEGEADQPSSISMLFVHPVTHDGVTVGAIVAGIPLWRMAQRLSRQAQMEHADIAGLVLWVYLFVGDRLFHFATAPEADEIIPDAETRIRGLRAGGLVGEASKHARSYAWSIVPAPGVGAGVGLVLVRSDPM